MYTMYYSFSNIPFHKELPHDKLFESTGFKEGLARMEHLKKTRGIGLIAGEAGSGKTSVIRAFTGNLNNSLYKVVYFPLSTVSPNDFYRGVLYGLGEIPKSKKVDMFAQIQAAVLTLYKNQKMTPVFVLDEMHLASNAFLDDIRGPQRTRRFVGVGHQPAVQLLHGLGKPVYPLPDWAAASHRPPAPDAVRPAGTAHRHPAPAPRPSARGGRAVY